MIRFDQVTKSYPDGTVAVDGLDLEAPSGQITVLVGPSGCGKTTSLRMINRMIQPSSGTVWIDDRDTARFKPTELRRGIGYVIQQAGLFPNQTVLDNIGTVPRLLGWSRRDVRLRAQEMLERVGLPASAARRYPNQLSGGQQQRVGVARALAADPPVLLMDEPFSSVDPVVRTQLQDELLRLQGELGKTIVFVTHDIDEAIRIGDRVAVMRPGGRLAQYGSPQELLSAPADAFVAGFLGKDRGYRALGFRPADHLPLTREPAVEEGAPLQDAVDAARDGWVLVADAERRPLGWLSAREARRAMAAGAADVRADQLALGGTLGASDGTLRAALDAALSSPSGRGVIVDEDGRLAGTVRADQVLARIRGRDGHEAAAAR